MSSPQPDPHRQPSGTWWRCVRCDANVLTRRRQRQPYSCPQCGSLTLALHHELAAAGRPAPQAGA